MFNLKMGDKEMECIQLKMLLNSSIFPSPCLPEDNASFDFQTHSLVVQFQTDKGLKPDGIVGPRTWKALLQNNIMKGPVYNLNTCLAVPVWLQIAKAECGVHEDSTPGQHNQRIISEYNRITSAKYKKDETAWCSSFVNWVMSKAGFKGTYQATARSWLWWGMKLDAPREGAITVIKVLNTKKSWREGLHVAFYIKTLPGYLCLLGGNQDGSVKYKNYALSDIEIEGFRWPS